jgi:hypothetical protein
MAVAAWEHTHKSAFSRASSRQHRTPRNAHRSGHITLTCLDAPDYSGQSCASFYGLRAPVFDSICCKILSILSVLRIYISGIYTTIAVIKNTHQMAANAYCCIRTLLAKVGQSRTLYSVARPYFGRNWGSAFITTSKLLSMAP